MNPDIPITPSAQPRLLVDLLNSAVVLNWDALTQSSPVGRVRVEYHIGPNGVLEYLKMWNTGREYWSLICEYSTHLGWSDGPRFCNGYHSRPLARLLQSIFLQQSVCTHDQRPDTNAMLEVGPPSLEDVEAAKLLVSENFRPPVAVRSKRAAQPQLLPTPAC